MLLRFKSAEKKGRIRPCTASSSWATIATSPTAPRRCSTASVIRCERLTRAQTAAQFAPNIALLDIGMPKLNGYELIVPRDAGLPIEPDGLYL